MWKKLSKERYQEKKVRFQPLPAQQFSTCGLCIPRNQVFTILCNRESTLSAGLGLTQKCLDFYWKTHRFLKITKLHELLLFQHSGPEYGPEYSSMVSPIEEWEIPFQVSCEGGEEQTRSQMHVKGFKGWPTPFFPTLPFPGFSVRREFIWKKKKKKSL